MSERFNPPKPQEHLKEGAKPIVVCIGAPDDFRNSGLAARNPSQAFNLDALHNVQWKGSPVASPLDNSNKFSENFCFCIGLIVAGEDKVTGQNISFLMHQDPISIMGSNALRSILKLLTEIKERCKEGTIDSVVIGGKGSSTYDNTYSEPIKFLGKEVQKILGFEPTIINGPKNTSVQNYQEEIFAESGDESSQYHDDIYYDNDHRRLYFVRPRVNPDAPDFLPSDLEKEKDNWK